MLFNKQKDRGEIISKLFNNRVYIVEGFDMVGKSYFMNKVMKEFSIYHPNHDITDETVGRYNSWVMGYGVVDMMSQTKPEDIVIDRGIFSSWVYTKLDGESTHDLEKVMKWYSNCDYFLSEIGHIRVSHYDKDSAKEIFELSKSRDKNPNKISAEYDNFEDFEQYWKRYIEAESLFDEAYDIVGITPIRVKTLPGKFLIEKCDIFINLLELK